MKYSVTLRLVLLKIISVGYLFITAGAFCQQKITPSLVENPSVARKYLNLITPDELSKKLYVIASDSFGGRGTGAKGQKMAARYIASFYRSLGILPKGNIKENNSPSLSDYFQALKLYEGAPKETTIELFFGGAIKATSTFSANKTDDLSYYLSGGATDAIGSVVFAGYGIADDTLDYNDYALLKSKNISIKDQWIMIFSGEPSLEEGTSLLNTTDHKSSTWAQGLITKRLALWRNGERPKGILVIMDDEPSRKTNFSQDAKAAIKATQISQQLFLMDPAEDLPQAFAISARFANQILASSGHTVEQLKQEINRNIKPTVFKIGGVSIKSIVKKKTPIPTENVFALIEGTDPRLKKEVVVISAHYDHLGIDASLEGDQIFNGAADDGSGTVAVLQMALAFKKATDDGFGPRRSILFANFTGEERGLLGSAYFTGIQPILPLKTIVADINMDGVGGIDSKHPTQSKNYVYISGEKGFSDSLIAMNIKVREAIGSNVELTDAPPGFGSDHQSFRNFHIPYLYYSSGKTDHYHQVSDEANTIDYDHMANVSQLVFATAWQAANQTNPIRGDQPKLKQVGFLCPPCGSACDNEVFQKIGICPYCRMLLVPKFVEEK